MAQYINKDVLVAEIERRKEINKYRDTNDSLFEDEAILSYINTLEVKKVDLDEEIQAFAKMELEPIKIYDANVSITITMHQLYQCAKHFFKLGLKAQKGE